MNQGSFVNKLPYRSQALAHGAGPPRSFRRPLSGSVCPDVRVKDTCLFPDVVGTSLKQCAIWSLLKLLFCEALRMTELQIQQGESHGLRPSW